MADLYPRLTAAGISIRLAELRSFAIADLAKTAVTTHRLEAVSASGGARISEGRLRELRAKIEAVARSNGYPERISSKSDFDADVGAFLALDWDLPVPEGLHSDVWSFLCLCLVPHVVAWRFSVPEDADLTIEKGVRERFVGGNRNALQRTWIRALKLSVTDHEDRVWQVRRLPEDTLVQIFERPGLSSVPSVARALARVALAQQSTMPKKDHEGVHRQAIKLIRARGAIRILPYLDSTELETLLRSSWNEARGLVEPTIAAVPRIPRTPAGSRPIDSPAGRGALHELLVRARRVVDKRQRPNGCLWVYLPEPVSVQGWTWSRKRSGLFTLREGDQSVLVAELGAALLDRFTEQELSERP